ncbi:MAG: ABC transporter permease [Chitinophagaceae bacterium]|nr:ABC transporter permease [Chitinophagaceae bacterium]MCW5927719.1 ABC transporter permease [Chitinophagaceae bacterium]
MYLLFAWRYFRAKKSTNAINIIAWVSVVAIGFATAALLVLWSTFNGFEGLVKSLYSTFYTDLKITASSGKSVTLTPEQIEALKKTTGVYRVSLTVQEKAAIQNGDYRTIVDLKGVDEAYTEVSTIENSMARGVFELGDAEEPGVVLGLGIENVLMLLSDRSIGKLTLYLPSKNTVEFSNPLSAFTEANVTPYGAFGVQQEFDNSYVLTNLAFLKEQLKLKPDEYTSAEIKLLREKDQETVKKSIQAILGQGYTIQTRYEQNSSLYSVMRLEKYAIYAIFILVLIVAAFNMIGALSMLVLEKQKDIQILQSMGATRSWIKKLFLAEGLVLAGIGAVSGILLAVLICFLQIQFKLIKLQGASFVIDYYPVQMIPEDFVLVVATVFVIAILASWIPASRASRQPFELRN